MQTEYKDLAGDLLIDSMGANAGTAGTAVDLIIRLILEPDETPMSALTLFPFNATYHQVVHELSALVGEAGDREVAARAAWALALCVNAYRAGPAWAPLVPDMVQSGQFTAGRMLDQADDAAVAELIALRELSQERLIPQLKSPSSLGPTFDLSEPGPAQRIAGEADLIAGGLLVDVKTTLAPRNKAGLRPDALKAENVYQLLGYVLLPVDGDPRKYRFAMYAPQLSLAPVANVRLGATVIFPLDFNATIDTPSSKRCLTNPPRMWSQAVMPLYS